MLAVIDYGMGNLLSVQNALCHLGIKHCVAHSSEQLNMADAIILPGVGAFDEALRNLYRVQMNALLIRHIEAGKPFLGICLGMQLLFNKSEEGQLPGLGLLKGSVRRFNVDRALTVPHMGWNNVQSYNTEILEDNAEFYFVHSYYVEPEDKEDILARTDYGLSFCSAVQKANITAVQFHPEKSGEAGLRFLSRWADVNHLK